MEENKVKKSEASQADASIKYTVMPKEFKKMSGKKINPKIFLIVGGVVVLLGISIGAVLIFTKKPQVIVEAPPITEIPTETPPPVETATTTEGGSSLLEPVAPPVETPVETPPEEIVGKLTPGADEDADGLTDKEEVIYQTDATRPDTDGDGFLDGNEIYHLYNPAAPPPVTLLESGIVKLYRNASFGYSVYYPTMWKASSTISMSEVDFVSDETEIIKIIAEEVDTATMLRSWYVAKFPERDINALQSFTSKQGYQGLQDAERLNTYIKKGNKIFTVTYDLGGTSIVWYRALYGMVLNSLIID